jgi:hypothetical protein
MTGSRSIDLHGCNRAEAIRQFVDFYNDQVRSGYQGFIEVVHGYGSSGAGGVIKRELRKYLEANVDRLEMFIPGGGIGNPGVTKVYPKKLLPEIRDDIGSRSGFASAAILTFCETARTKEKIIAKLRGRFGDRVLCEEINRLVRDGRLRDLGGKLVGKTGP